MVDAEPSLVLVDGVWVVEDYDEPVFYDEGFYWRFYGGVWYRSSIHTGNWVRVDVVPSRVRMIDRPTRFVRYRGAATAQKRRGPPDHAPAHGRRGDAPGHEMGGGGGPPDRGDKAEMKEEKMEAKEERKEAKEEAKAERKEAKEEAKAEKKEAKEEAKAEKKEAKEDKGEKKEKGGGGGKKGGKKDNP